jgi:putative heme-binding domain-containing protein
MQAIAAAAKPLLEERAADGKVQREPLLELRRLYAGPAPVRAWRVSAPVPAGAAPAAAAAPALEASAWTPLEAESDGKLALPPLEGGSASVRLAAAVVPSTAARLVELFVRHEGTADLWWNGERLVERRLSGWDGEPRRVRARLRKGDNELLLRLETGPGKIGAIGVHVPEPDGSALFDAEIEEVDLEAYAAPARAGTGDAGRGRALFFDLKGAACSKCHAVQGQGGQVGPDLSGVGAQFDRAALIESVLYPSRRVRGDYQQVIIVTRSGEVRAGAARGETEEAVTIVDAEGKLHAIPRVEIDRREASDLSLMPEGLHASFAPEGFADLIAFLEGLRASAAR